eukprot:1449491-Pleurochrysis_carterae.AAC.4
MAEQSATFCDDELKQHCGINPDDWSIMSTMLESGHRCMLLASAGAARCCTTSVLYPNRSTTALRRSCASRPTMDCTTASTSRRIRFGFRRPTLGRQRRTMKARRAQRAAGLYTRHEAAHLPHAAAAHVCRRSVRLQT